MEPTPLFGLLRLSAAVIVVRLFIILRIQQPRGHVRHVRLAGERASDARPVVKKTLGGLIGTICKGAGAIAIAIAAMQDALITHGREQPLYQSRYHSIGLLDMTLRGSNVIWGRSHIVRFRTES
jgi:hypothetical protein